MLKAFKASFLLIFLIWLPVICRAETLREKANRVCDAFIENSQNFVEVETFDCEAIPMYQDQAIKSKCFHYTNAGTQAEKTFVYSPSLGSCSSTDIRELNEDKTGKYLPIAIDGYMFGEHDHALNYKGQLFFSHGTDLRMLHDGEQRLLCSFSHRSEGWQLPEPKDNPICQKFGNNDFLNTAESIKQEDRDKWPKYPEAFPAARFIADLDSDEKKEIIVGYDYASGAGCGCDSKRLVLFTQGELVGDYRGRKLNQSTVPQELESLAQGLSMTHRCGGMAAYVVNIDGDDYVLIEHDFGSKGEEWPVISEEIPVRELYEFRSGKFEKICSQSAHAKMVVTKGLYNGAYSIK